MNRRQIPAFHAHLLLIATMLPLVVAGCQKSAPTPVASPAGSSAAPPATVPPSPGHKEPGRPPETSPTDAARLLNAAADSLKSGDLDAAQKLTAQITGLQKQLSAVEVDRLNQLVADLEEKQREQVATRRAKRLAEAGESLALGKLEDAALALDDVLKEFPTDEQRKSATVLRAKIEEHRRRRREFAVALRLLGSEKPNEVRDAKRRFAEDAEVALPLLVEAISGQNQTLAVNALETLRSLNEPERTLPALLGVLSRKEQATLWPVAVREMQKIAVPGAGEPLLKLALESTDALQRTAALTALAGIVDPPAQSLVVLLPMILADGPDLPLALAAARHAVAVHRQFDLLTLRGIEGDLTPEQEQRLAGLGARLATLAVGAPDARPVGPGLNGADEARALGVLTRQLPPQPLADVKVLRASVELPESPAAAVIDGVWNSVEPKTMWRHPVDKPVSIVLDLGVERTVAAIRLWNENEQNGRHRGWKDVDIYVSNTPASLTPVARGIVPQAPGAANPPDYATTVSVPCVRGRYVRLECRSQWQPDGVAGLAELQVLGF